MSAAFATVWVDGQPFLVPADPLDIEALPPADLDDCSHCDGLGARVVYIEADTGLPVDEECHWCAGTGDRQVRS